MASSGFLNFSTNFKPKIKIFFKLNRWYLLLLIYISFFLYYLKKRVNLTVSDFEIEINSNSASSLNSNFLSTENLRFHLSEGVVTVLDKNLAANFQKSFNAPIVNAWLISSSGHQQLNIFNSKLNPSIDKTMANKSSIKFLGKYKNQMFIKEFSTVDQSLTKPIRFNQDYHSNFFQFIADITNTKNALPSSTETDDTKHGFYIGYNSESAPDENYIFYPQLSYEAHLAIKQAKQVTLWSFWYFLYHFK